MSKTNDRADESVEQGQIAQFIQASHFLTLSKTTNFRLFQIERVCQPQF